MDNQFYVYRHIRLDTNTPFYVGKGSILLQRAYQKGTRRSEYWNRIVSKYGYIVEIIEKNLTEEQAFAKEIELIKSYKSQGYCEANFTDGGEGASGLVFSKEHREKLSKSQKGKKHSEGTRKKMSDSKKGQKPWIKGKKHSEESCQKMSEAHKGKVSWNRGRKFSEETRKKMSEARRGKFTGKNHPSAKKVICTKTNKIWDTIKDAAEFINITPEYLAIQLRGVLKNKTTLIYYKETT